MPTPTPIPSPDRGPRLAGPHLSDPGGWAILLAFLALTLLGIVLYLLRVEQAAT